MEVPLAIASRARLLLVAAVLGAVLGPERLHRGPSLDQGPVHRKVLSAQKPAHLGVSDHPGQELRRNLRLQQAVAVLAEHRRVPDRIIHAKPHEPAEQQVEVQLLHQLAL